MKTIAVLTLFFLPSTLIAVRLHPGTKKRMITDDLQSVYSSGIFDLQADRIHVSGLWWTFVVSSLVLTLIVLTIWAVYLWLTHSKNHPE